MRSTNTAVPDSLVMGQSSQGLSFRGSLLGLTRFHAVFEIYDPAVVLRLSEVISELKIILSDRPVYSGRAVISNLVNAGTVLVCDAKLEEGRFNLTAFPPLAAADHVRAGFSSFLEQWQKLYRVLPEFKVVVADMQTFLTDLRLWLEQVELEIRAAPAADRAGLEQAAAGEIGRAAVSAFDALHERLEALSEKIETEHRPVHQVFAKRHLHPLMLCSPFASRTFHKPLGHAGDYEMVNMILRDPYEGGSLFAKIVNLWFLSQWPAKAHRNRIAFLKQRLVEEAVRARKRGRPARVLNLGCGPAREVQEFLMESELCEHANFTLWDFDAETIAHTSRILEDLRVRYGRRTRPAVERRSVHHVLKEGGKPQVKEETPQYDYIYCAGLFDYLSDQTCRQLMGIFYRWLAPGGRLVATNVDACKPFRHMLEFVLDWHLIYRDARQGAALIPAQAPPEAGCVHKDPTEVNVFIEVRKGDHV